MTPIIPLTPLPPVRHLQAAAETRQETRRHLREAMDYIDLLQDTVDRQQRELDGFTTLQASLFEMVDHQAKFIVFLRARIRQLEGEARG